MITPRLDEIQIESFRGVARALTLDLSGDALLVRGDNGLGKTTLVDAVTWLFCGELPHLAERVRGLRKGDDPIVNCYAGAQARVRLHLRAGDALWRFERVGSSSGTALSGMSGELPLDEPAGALADLFGHGDYLAFKNAVQTWGILRQDAVRAALDAGASLHERLARVVGLERVTTFSASATRLAKDVARDRRQLQAEVESAKKSELIALTALDEVRARALTGASQLVAESLRQLQSRMPAGLVLNVDALAQTGRLVDLGRSLGLWIEQAENLLTANKSLEELSGLHDRDLSEASAALAAAQTRWNDVTRRAPLVVQLATSASELLGPTCPVCEQTIDTATVARHLEELLETGNADRAAESDARAAVQLAQERLASAQQLSARRGAAEGSIAEARATLVDLLSTDQPLAVDASWLEASNLGALIETLRSVQSDLRIAYQQLPETSAARISSAEAAVNAAKTEVARLTVEFDDVDGRWRRSTQLDTAAHSAAERIIDAALLRIAPSFAEVFDRLSPHPTFTVLRARQDIFYGKNQVVPEVYDPERNIAANPLAVYSEGQLNVVALSYFLGLALNAREGALPFMILDDPLQAMDVLGVLGFSDLCRRIRDQRQLIVTTHDRRFADVLSRKLTPRDPAVTTNVIEFLNWGREGPEVRQTRLAPASEERVLREA